VHTVGNLSWAGFMCLVTSTCRATYGRPSHTHSLCSLKWCGRSPHRSNACVVSTSVFSVCILLRSMKGVNPDPLHPAPEAMPMLSQRVHAAAPPPTCFLYLACATSALSSL
jgi:hypothetical protein